MTGATIRYVTQGLLALVAVGGAVAYALVAQSKGLSPEPPAWLSLLIGIIGGFFYSQAAHSNGNTAALQTMAAAISARRAADPQNTVASVTGSPPPSNGG